MNENIFEFSLTALIFHLSSIIGRSSAVLKKYLLFAIQNRIKRFESEMRIKYHIPNIFEMGFHERGVAARDNESIFFQSKLPSKILGQLPGHRAEAEQYPAPHAGIRRIPREPYFTDE